MLNKTFQTLLILTLLGGALPYLTETQPAKAANGEQSTEKNDALQELKTKIEKENDSGNYDSAEKLLLQEIALLKENPSTAYADALDEHAKILRHLFKFQDAEKETKLALSVRSALKEKKSNEQTKTWTDPTKANAASLKDIQSAEDLDRWTTYYYLSPHPELTVKALLFTEKAGLLDKATVEAPLIALYSQVFAQNPKQLPTWVKELHSLKLEHKKIIWKALWQANTEESRKAANVLAEEFPAASRPPLLTASANKPQPIEKMELSPAVLDMLWASFFTTGDERYVERVISALPGLAAGQHDMNKMLTAGAASWSLTANARAHQRVMNICLSAAQSHPEWKPELDKIVAKAQQAPEPKH